MSRLSGHPMSFTPYIRKRGVQPCPVVCLPRALQCHPMRFYESQLSDGVVWIWARFSTDKCWMVCLPRGWCVCRALGW